MLPISEHPTHRRRRYLLLVIDILGHDLELLGKAWQEWRMPRSAQAAHSLQFSIVRNWHGVAASLPAEDAGAVTVLLVKLLDGPRQPRDDGSQPASIASVAGLRQLDGWPADARDSDPARIVQAVGNWLNQHYN